MGRAESCHLQIDLCGLINQRKLVLIISGSTSELFEFGMIFPAASVEAQIGAARNGPANRLMPEKSVVDALTDQIAQRLDIAAESVVDEGGIDDRIQIRRFGHALACIVDGAQAIENIGEKFLYLRSCAFAL